MSSLTEDTVPATRRLPIDDSFPKGPNVGELLPDFESVDQSGSKVRFSEARGQSRAIVVFHRSAGW